MQKYLLAIIVGLGLAASAVYLLAAKPVAAAQTPQSTAVFDPDGKLKLPNGFRRWVFVGAPLTPNGLNNGKANFPEYHHVYIEKKNVDAYLKTGSFPEGTVIIKELTRVLIRLSRTAREQNHPGVGSSTAPTTASTRRSKTASGSLRQMAGASSLSAIIHCRMQDRRGDVCYRMCRLPYRQCRQHRHDVDPVLSALRDKPGY